MKILFIGAHNDSFHYINDYMSDLLLHGLRSLHGDDVIDYPGSWHIYKNQNEKKETYKDKLWGKGFTTSDLLEDYNVIDRSDIKNKIKKKYFDIIIYSSIRRNDTFFEDVINSQNKFFFIDGEDDDFLSKKYYEKGIYFKRELKIKKKAIFPISFAIPEEKIIKNIQQKPSDLLSPLIPGKLDTYIYESENKYYEMYQNSVFALTYKKTGWDCLRHYEILMNGCIPLFLDLEKCPTQTLVNFPKERLINIKKEYEKILKYYNPFKIFKKKFLNFNNMKNFFTYKFYNKNVSNHLNNDPKIYDLKENLLTFTKSNLTTKSLAKYVLNKLN